MSLTRLNHEHSRFFDHCFHFSVSICVHCFCLKTLHLFGFVPEHSSQTRRSLISPLRILCYSAHPLVERDQSFLRHPYPLEDLSFGSTLIQHDYYIFTECGHSIMTTTTPSRAFLTSPRHLIKSSLSTQASADIALLLHSRYSR